MGYEGQLGALDTWLDRTYTGNGERPWMANTLKAHQDHSQRQGLRSFSFRSFFQAKDILYVQKIHLKVLDFIRFNCIFVKMTLTKAETHTNILYGNTNYQQLSQMNSVTKSQVIFNTLL